MRTIYKYTLDFSENNIIAMPKGARLIYFDIQDCVPCVWADVTTTNPVLPRTLAIHGTGHPIDPLSCHIGSVKDGHFVWHLYDKEGYP